MSKKDYQAIARAIHAQLVAIHDGGDTCSALLATKTIGLRIADVFATDNPRFDRARFMEACETGRCKGMRAA